MIIRVSVIIECLLYISFYIHWYNQEPLLVFTISIDIEQIMDSLTKINIK